MKLQNIALSNLRRRKGRTMFLLLTFLVVVGTSVTLNAISLGLKQDLDAKLSSLGANIVISAKSEHLALSYGGLSVPGVTYDVQKLSASALDKLKQVSRPEDITAIAPAVIGAASGDKRKYVLAGVDFPAELKMKTWWKVDGSLPQGDEAVIGSGLAVRDKIGPGDSLRLNGKSVKISGVLEQTGGSEDMVVFSPIELVRRLTGLKDSFTLIEVNAKDPENMAAELAKLLPGAKVTPVTQLVEGATESVNRFTRFALMVSILLAVVGTMVVVVTLSGNVNDRTRELGIFRAIGFRQRHILSILFTEVLLISVTGGLGGYLLGITAPVVFGPLLAQSTVVQSGLAAAQGRAAAGQAMGFAWYPWLGLGSVLTACIVGLLAITYPAWRAVKLDPAEALRFI